MFLACSGLFQHHFVTEMLSPAKKKKKKKNIFTLKKLTKLVREKYPLLQLDCNKWNYAQIYTEKNGPNNRLIKKEKNQTICSTNFKGGTRRKPTGFVIKPRLILTKHKQLYTIVIIRCYHQSMLLWVSFLKAKALEKGDFIFKKK